ncbi:hypothetical protein A5722_30970 [Mycobacterium vulneris]|nr:hypothetical protein A5722_30970 [Mycolicibacterium vulneris]OCB64571.1 hypothetical protein A5729_19925 [Mycolicibacterium vulneris]
MTVTDVTQPGPRPARKAELFFAINDLRAAVDRLVTPYPRYINNQYIEVPGLYGQLVAALAGEQGTGTSGIAKSRAPFRIDAADMKYRFDEIVQFNLPSYGMDRNVTSRLLALANHAWTVEQTRAVRRIAGILNSWADDFESLIAHGHILRITAACPACRAETVHRYDSAGELIRDTALIATEVGAHCQSCEHRWGPHEFIDLSKQLGTLPAGVLE